MLARLSFPATGREHQLTVRVLVEDVTRADASGVVVAEAAVPDVVVPPRGTVIQVSLTVAEPLLPSRHYAVRAHASVSGAATFAAGDFLSTSATPPADQVDLELRQV